MNMRASNMHFVPLYTNTSIGTVALTTAPEASSSDSNTLDEFQIYQRPESSRKQGLVHRRFGRRFRLKVVSTFGSMAPRPELI